MPETDVVLYAEDGESPFLQWMDDIPQKAQDKCVVKVERLRELGHEIRRPEGDYLRDGIYELRAGLQGVNYRILYFFVGGTAVVSHGLTKEASVPPGEIDLAVRRKQAYDRDPEMHTYMESSTEAEE